MNNYEQLMQEASQGNKKAFKELYSYAGSGNAEAQYYLALYYKKAKGSGQDSDYAYWMKKAKDNSYVPQSGSITIVEEEYRQESVSESEEGNKIDLWFLIGFEGRVGRSLYIFVTAIYILLGFAVSSASNEMSRDDNPNSFVLLILSILGLTLWYIWIAQAVKRSHDIGHSGWWIWIPFYIVWLLFARGDEGENEYGNEPA